MLTRNNIGINPNDPNIIETDAIVKEIAIEKPSTQNIFTKIFIILFILSMFVGYLIPFLSIPKH